ncbi:MAG: hypothetical protein ACOCG5_11285 [Candidatus Alkaliphilus sp. MAG34]|nr:hypothetical protein [Clostridiales bacterium]
MNRNIRSLENMPLNIKFLYGKLLGAMVLADGDHNQLRLAEFYRIINNIRLPSKERIQLLNSIAIKKVDFSVMRDEIDLDRYLNEQERNIFRFSLMKDLIIIMKSDYIETSNEKELLKDIQNYFHVSDEQLSLFRGEYELDRRFFDDATNDQEFRNIVINIVSTAAALGIPLVVLNYSGTFKGLSTLGTISGLRAMGRKKRTGKSSILMGLATSILLGITTYKTMKYIFSIKKDGKTKLVQLIREHIEELHESTKDIIYKDIEYFTNRVAETKDEGGKDLDNALKIISILKRAVATLENTKAIII